MTYTFELGDGAHALDAQMELDWQRGWQVVNASGGSNLVTPGTNALEVDVASGDINAGGTTVSCTTATLDLSTLVDPDNPRKVVIYRDASGTAQTNAGTPEAADPTGATQRDANRPAPPSMSAVDGVVLATVWLSAGASDVVSGDIRDRRLPASLNLDSVSTESINNTRTVSSIGNLQTAVDNYDIVRVVPGSYDVGSNYPIAVPDNTTLILHGAEFTSTASGTTNIGLIENADATNGNTNIKIYGGTFDGASSGSGIEPTFGIQMDNADDVTIKDTTVKNYYRNGIRSVNGNNLVVENNLVDACGQDGSALNMSLADSSKECRVAFNVSRNCAGTNGIAVGGAPGTASEQGHHTVIGNLAYNNPEYGILVEKAGIGTTVTGNIAWNNSIGGFFLTDNSDDLTVGTNVSVGNGTNYIVASTNTSVTLNGCISGGATSRGYFIEGENTTLDGCHSRGEGGDGIRVETATDVSVTDCRVRGASKVGIRVDSTADETKVDNNIVTDSGEQGILVSANGCEVNDNKVRNSLFGGIRITAADYTCTGNRSAKNTNGIEVVAGDGTVSNNTVMDNNTDGILLDGVTNVSVVANRCGNHDTTDQNYGIDRSASGNDYISYVGNTLRGNVSAAYNGTIATNSVASANIT